MTGRLTAFAFAAACALTSIAQAGELRMISQTAEFDETQRLMTPLMRLAGDPASRDLHLGIAEKVTIRPFDPDLGELRAVYLTLKLDITHWFSGAVGDGLPLDEASEPVSAAAYLSSRIDVVGPNSAFLWNQVVSTVTARCRADGTCAFSEEETRPLALVLKGKPGAFTGTKPIALTIRGTSVGGVLAQLCPPGSAWQRCQVDDAGLRIASPPDGLEVVYEYLPSGKGGLLPAAEAGGAMATASGWSLFSKFAAGGGAMMLMALTLLFAWQLRRRFRVRH